MQWNQNYYDQLIQKIDQFTRKFYINKLIRGSLYFVGLCTVVFIVLNLLEHQFYFGKGTRKLMFFGFLALFSGSFYYWVLNPLLHYFRLGKLISHEDAAKIIGKHFTDVKDKLLNVLQLKHQAINFSDRSLIEASIEQKAGELRPVPFVAAIDLQKNRKYIQYAFLPLLLLGGIWFWSPSLIKDPTKRLIENNKEFEKAALFSFELQNGSLKTEQNSDFILRVKTKGSVMPAEVMLEADQFQYKMQQESAEEFVYTFSNLQKNTKFKLISGEITSQEYELEVVMKPLILGFTTILDYPSYTSRKDEQLENTGDLTVPAGTKLTWNLNTANTNQMWVKWNYSNRQALQQTEETQYRFAQQALKDGSYTIFYKNNELAGFDSVQYQISVIPDQYPQISVEAFPDSNNTRVIYFAGDVSDDYGLKNLNFHYTIKNEQSAELANKTIPVSLSSDQTNSSFKYVLDMEALGMQAGDKISYYFEIWDNDAINGSKSSKSNILDFRQSSKEELSKQEENNSQELKKDLEKSIEDAKRLQQKLADFKNKMLQEKDVEWNNKRDLEKMMKEQEQIQKQFEEAKNKYEENLKNQNQHSTPDEKTQEKQQQLQQLMNESMSEEMKQLMKQIQELMQQLNKDQAVKMSEQFENKSQDMTKEMERLLELFKELELEKNRKDVIDKMRELANEQRNLGDKTEKKELSPEESKKQQEELEKKLDEINKKQEENQKKNSELEKPKDMKDRKKENEAIKKDQKDSKQKLDQKDSKGGGSKQKDAADKMDEQANQMEQEMQEEEKEEHEEDIKVLKQLLENLVSLSFDQEQLIKEVSITNSQTPRYVSLVQDEFRLKDNFRLVEDTLTELSKRVMEISSFVMDKVDEINDNFKQTIENLEGRNVSAATGNQHRVMKNVNDLAVMLSETMSKKQQQAAACNKPGSGSCNKPGGKGSKPSKSGKKPSDKISDGQGKIGDEMKGLQKKQQEGQGKLSKEYAQLAAKQAQLRKLMEDLEREKREQGQGAGQMSDIIKEMNKIEKDLVNKNLTNETLKRQQEITTRLLEAERAEREREYKDERKSETGTNIDRKFPPQLEEYIKKRQAETEWFQQVSPELRPFYKNLVDQYFQNLKKQ
ncbi:MAG TPA: DUF4175 family protein [Saprospiraceae bacterium]|nr:DUF4175 family protein [Saprospiraceae bacterium]